MQTVSVIPAGSARSLATASRPDASRPEVARSEADTPARGRRLLAGLLLALIVLSSVLLAHLGCDRMRAAAPIGSLDGSGRVVSGYGWSLHPVGFMVRYADGSTATALWW